MLSKIILAASVAMLIGTTSADAQRYGRYGYGYGGYGYGYSSFDRNTNGGAGHHAGETNGF
jgi:hypothetical protein